MKKILITFPDWEERSFLGFEDSLNKFEFNEVHLFKFTQGSFVEETEMRISQMKSLFHNGEKFFSYDLSNLSNQTSVYIWQEMQKFFAELSFVESEFYLDISTMPRELIWMFISNFRSKKVTEVNILYHLPKSYSEDWLSRDPMNPRLLFQHSGVFDLSKNTALFIVSGFDSDRVQQIVNYYEADKVFILVPEGNQYNNVNRNSIDYHSQVTEVFTIDAYNDFELTVIHNEVRELLSTHNVILTSLGPKITAVSLYKIFCEFPEVALSYVPCKTYNLQYSSGYTKTILKKLSF